MRTPGGEAIDDDALLGGAVGLEHVEQEREVLGVGLVRSVAWKLMNEPRGVGVSPGLWLDWVRDAAGVLRGHVMQLVSLGDEGQQCSFEDHDEPFWRRANGAHLFDPAQGASVSAALDLVDVASAHLYLGNEQAAFARFSLRSGVSSTARGWRLQCARGSPASAPGSSICAWHPRDGFPTDSPANRCIDFMRDAATEMADAQGSGEPPPSR